ncbi:MAG: MBL fold metallo-hydrolase [Gammaproteobacteria bacterium]|nr:MBL fold metallo-hydrolase [Gammaproteobacteria bacterium]
MKLTFLGAAREVTGSCLLFEADGATFLVDCGMYQGRRALEDRNAESLHFDPRRLSFVILSHAHIDHSGLLPRLVREGFHGRVYTTRATIELLEVLLNDSAWIQQQEYVRAQRHGRRRPPPLYDADDVARLLELCEPVRYGAALAPAPGIKVILHDAGHILGSASVELHVGSGRHPLVVAISGDLGQPGRPILRDPAPPPAADLVICESTYGNRDHKPLDETLDELVDVVRDTLENRGGNVIIPAFAVGRTQELLYCFKSLAVEGRLRGLDVFVDSPMATAVTRITERHFELYDEEARRLAKVVPADGDGPRIQFLATAAESMSLNDRKGGAVIVAASGMCEGGRIRHHLRHHLPNARNTVLFTGFQAGGTLGRAIVDGATSVRIHGDEVPVRARIVTLGGFSAHADQTALLAWLGRLPRKPARLCLVHGEEQAGEDFAAAIEARFGWQAERPLRGDSLELPG